MLGPFYAYLTLHSVHMHHPIFSQSPSLLVCFFSELTPFLLSCSIPPHTLHVHLHACACIHTKTRLFQVSWLTSLMRAFGKQRQWWFWSKPGIYSKFQTSTTDWDSFSNRQKATSLFLEEKLIQYFSFFWFSFFFSKFLVSVLTKDVL